MEGSGWTSALVQADSASTGIVDSFIKARHVTKTRHADQATAAAVHVLLHQAYDEYVSQTQDDGTCAMAFEEWCAAQAQQSVHFDYWMKTLSLEIILLLYIRSIRKSNFYLYVKSLAKIIPWMFALDHTHYSRWLPV